MFEIFQYIRGLDPFFPIEVLLYFIYPLFE